MSLFGINTISSALQATQLQMDITGQNVANADTVGYSRQIAVLQPAGSDQGDSTTGAIGDGVDVATVQREHATWLDSNAAALSGNVGSTGIDAQTATQVENLLNEPGSSGLQATLTSFYNAFDSLANNPTDGSTRDSAVSAAQAVATGFNNLTNGLATVKSGIVTQAQTDLATVNQTTAQIATLDQSIQQSLAEGNQPNELLDQRDQLVAKLTSLTGATVTGQSGANLVVSVAGATLVQGTESQNLALSTSNGLSLSVAGTGSPVTISSGSLGSEQNWVNNTLPGYQQQVHTLATTLSSNVNSLVESGVDKNGNAGTALFTVDSSGQMSVSATIAANSSLLAAGAGAAGDGSIAQQIAALASGSSSIDPTYQQLVSTIGSASSNSTTASTTAQAALTQIQGMQTSQSGVNLDQELSNMVSIQQAYSASARMLSAYDQMLTTLMQNTTPTG